MGHAPVQPQLGPKRKILDINEGLSNDGLYLKANIYGINVNCLVDTGATLSILHPAKYRQIPENLRPKLQPATGNLKTADGGSTVPEGYALIPVSIANHIYWSKMVIASVDGPAAIGYDFLFENQCQIDVRKGCIELQGQIVTCQRETNCPKSLL